MYKNSVSMVARLLSPSTRFRSTSSPTRSIVHNHKPDEFVPLTCRHWTSLAGGFLLLDGAAGVLGMYEFMQRPKAKSA